MAIGYGGDALLSAAAGLAWETIRNGRRELARGADATSTLLPEVGRAVSAPSSGAEEAL